MASRYTQDELAELTDEEREGLAEMEAEEAADEADDTSADDTDAGEAGQEDAEEGAAEKGEADAESEAAAAPEPQKQEQQEPPAAAAPEAETEAGTEERAAPQQVRDYGYPENYEARIADIDAKRDSLAQRLDDGEITGREFNAQARELDRQAQDLRDQKLRAEVSYDRDFEAWQGNVGKFLAAHPEYRPGTPLYVALDGEVRRLQEESGGSLDPVILGQAHANLVAQRRKSLGLPDEAAKAPPAAPAQKKPDPARPKPAIPPTLAHVPAAATEDTGDTSAFAYLDRLAETNFEKYEAELLKLTPDQLDRYENGA